MKFLLKTILSASIFFCVNIFAQKGANITLHTIKSGETLSALAAKYGTNVGDIMRLNGMNAKSQLTIGEAIKIPSNKTAAATNTKPLPVSNKQVEIANAALTGKTHTVQQGETLYKLSKQYNISIAQLQEWNGMTDLNVKIGQTLNLSATNVAVSNTDKKATNNTETNKPIVNNSATVSSTPATTKPVENGTAKESATEKELTTIVQEPEAIAKSAKYVQSEGFFANYFDFKSNNKNTLTGDASILKTVSGWTDKKYYVLMNDVAQGTIVRISSNNKHICAKVLGSLPDIKEDNGLLLRLSNAAVAELGIEDVKFTVMVSY